MAVEVFFQAQECLYVQAGLPWCCVTRGGKLHTRVKEMSGAWGTDYRKDNLPTSSRGEIELNVLIQRGRAPLLGALGINVIHCLSMSQMECSLRKLTSILCLSSGPQLPSGHVP